MRSHVSLLALEGISTIAHSESPPPECRPLNMPYYNETEILQSARKTTCPCIFSALVQVLQFLGPFTV